MTLSTFLDKKYTVVFAVLLLVVAHVLWDLTHGGVPVHYPLADDSLPPITNWWGLLSIPLITCFLLSRIESRRSSESSVNKKVDKSIVKGFFGALIFGLAVALCWEFGAEHILQYLILLPLVIALFVPVHRAEHLLGFVLAMAYTFGGVLPIFIGAVLLALSWLVYKVLHQGGIWILGKFR